MGRERGVGGRAANAGSGEGGEGDRAGADRGKEPEGVGWNARDSATVSTAAMTTRKISEAASAHAFIVAVSRRGEVWSLEKGEKYVTSASAADPARVVMPYWSSRERAVACMAPAWEGFAPRAIPLERFIERWLVGMHVDHVLVGPDWDARLDGIEVEPRGLMVELAARLPLEQSKAIYARLRARADGRDEEVKT